MSDIKGILENAFPDPNADPLAQRDAAVTSTVDSIFANLGNAVLPDGVADSERAKVATVTSNDLPRPEPIRVNEIVAAASKGLDAGSPRTLEQARALARDQGSPYELDEESWDEMTGHAGLLAVDFLKASGLWARVTPETFNDLVAAYRYNLVRSGAPLLDEERDGVIAAAGNKLIAKAEEVVLARLEDYGQQRELSLTGDRPPADAAVQARIKADQELYGRLRQARSLAASGDRMAMAAIDDFIGRASRRSYVPKNSTIEAEQAAAVKGLTPNPAVPQGLVYNVGRTQPGDLGKLATLDKAWSLRQDLEAALASGSDSTAAEQAARLAATESFRTVRLARLGLDPETVDAVGYQGSLGRSHPNLLARLSAEAINIGAAAVNGAPLPVLAAETHVDEAANTILGLAAQIGPTLRGLDVGPTTSGANFWDRQLTAFGDLVRRIGETTDAALSVAGSLAPVYEKIPGTEITPENVRLADRDRINAGIKEGRIDPLTVARFANDNSNYLPGVLAAALDAISDGTAGKVAAGALSPLLGADLHPVVARRLIAEARDEAAVRSIAVAGFGNLAELRARAEKQTQEASARLRAGDSAGALKEGLVAVAHRTNLGIMESIGALVSDPTTFLGVAGVGWVAGRAGASALSHAKAPFQKAMARGLTLNKVRRDFRRLVAIDPEAAGRLRDTLHEFPAMLGKSLSEHSVNGLMGVLDVLEKEGSRVASDIARLGSAGVDRFWAKRNGQLSRLGKYLRQADGTALEQMLAGAGIERTVVEAMLNPVTLSPLRELAAQFVDRLTTRQGKIPTGLTVRGRNVASEIESAIDQGTIRARDLESLPLPATTEAGKSLVHKVLDRVPLLRAAAVPNDVETTSIIYRLSRFISDTGAFAVNLRNLNTYIGGGQDLLLRAVSGRVTTELRHSFAALRPIRATPGARKVLRTGVTNVRRMRQIHDAVTSRDWRQPVKLSDDKWFRQRVTLGELVAIGREHLGAGQFTNTLRRFRRTGRAFMEPESAFVRRYNETLELERLITEKAERPPGFDAKAARKRVRDYKTEILRKVFDRAPVSDQVNLDIATDEIAAPAVARTVREKRRAVSRLAARTVDPKKNPRLAKAVERAQAEVAENPNLYDPASNYGFDKIDVAGPLADLRRLANTQRAQDVLDAHTAMTQADPGNLTAVLRIARNAEVNARGALYARQMQVEKYFDALDGLPAADRVKFDEALGDLVRGHNKPMADFLNASPEFRASVAPVDDVEALGAAWKDQDNLRVDLLSRAQAVGLIDREVFNHFVRDYSPQLYDAYEFKNIADARIRDVMTRSSDPGVQTGAHRMAEFDLQRDHYRFRLQVRQKGQAWVDRKFNTREAAEEWARSRWTLGEWKQEKGLGISNRTPMGDEVLVLDPLGEETVNALLPLGRGVALGARVAQLARDVAVREFVQLLDRPGWIVSEAEMNSLRLSGKMPRRAFKHYVKLPHTKTWGPLGGKLAHKRVTRALQSFLETDESLARVADEVREITLSSMSISGAVFQGFGRVLTMQTPILETIRSMIGTNAIQRNPAAWFNGMIMDRELLSPMVVGRHVTEAAKGKAFRHLFGVSSFREGVGLKAPSDEILRTVARGKPNVTVGRQTFNPQDFFELPGDEQATFLGAVEDGMLGDTIVGSPLNMRMRRKFIELLYGRSDAFPNLRRMLANRTLRRAANRVGLGESWFDSLSRATTTIDDNSTQARTLAAGRDHFQRQLDRGRRAGTLSPEREASLLDSIAGREEALSRLNPGNLNRAWDWFGWFTGAKSRFGTFGEVQTMSNQMYARFGNYYRLASYYDLLDQGVPRKIAAQRVRDFMQDYSAIPSFARHLRQGVTANPIFSFPLELARITKNMMAQQPERLVAAMVAAPFASTVNLAAAGVDPRKYYEELGKDGWLGAAIRASYSLAVLTPDGGIAIIELPGISPLQILRQPSGLLGELVRGAEQGGGLSGAAWSAGGRLLGNFYGSNIMTDLAYKLALGKDPLTQKVIPGGMLGRSAAAARGVMDVMVPGWLPFWGAKPRGLLDTVRSDPDMSSTRIREPFERMLRNVFGINSRGGFFTQLADQIGAGGAIDSGTKVFLDIAAVGEAFHPLRLAELAGLDRRYTVGEPVNIPAQLPRARGFKDEDVLHAMLIASSKYDPATSQGSSLEDTTHLEDLRTANFYESHAIKTGDKETLGWARRLRADVNRRIAEHIAAQKDLLKDRTPETIDETVADLQRKKYDRALESMTPQYAFQQAGVLRQVRTLMAASAMGLDESLVNSYGELALYGTNVDARELRRWTSTVAVRLALADLQGYLKDRPKYATGLGSLWELHDALDNALPDLLQREEDETIMQEFRAESYRQWAEATK